MQSAEEPLDENAFYHVFLTSYTGIFKPNICSAISDICDCHPDQARLKFQTLPALILEAAPLPAALKAKEKPEHYKGGVKLKKAK